MVLSFSVSAVGKDESGMALQQPSATFVLQSPEVTNGGNLPKDYTGDGTSSTLPLEWTGAPQGTKSFALIMHHVPPDGGFKWYWILYNIPLEVQSLPKNVKDVGTLGNNSVNDRTEYAPPHSKGPGAKTYVYTVYALSAPLQINVPPSRVNREVLLNSMKDKILARAELSVVYSRPGDRDTSGEGRGSSANQPPPRPKAPGPGDRPLREPN